MIAQFVALVWLLCFGKLGVCCWIFAFAVVVLRGMLVVCFCELVCLLAFVCMLNWVLGLMFCFDFDFVWMV